MIASKVAHRKIFTAKFQNVQSMNGGCSKHQHKYSTTLLDYAVQPCTKCAPRWRWSPIESQCSNASCWKGDIYTNRRKWCQHASFRDYAWWTLACRLMIEICIAWRFDQNKRFFGGFISSDIFSDISVISARLRMLTWFRVIIQK